ncbi:MAG TPA: hypothetical protein VD999_00565 [Vitreimonas sp.]|nr:hypothetical protein [Vitreimonas sp.]
MGALPKNKITRAEQGARRHGNTPKLQKDSNSSIPMHKQGFVAQFMKFIGAAPATADKTNDKAESREAKKAAKAAELSSVAGTKAAPQARGKATNASAPIKGVRKAQHKG